MGGQGSGRRQTIRGVREAAIGKGADLIRRSAWREQIDSWILFGSSAREMMQEITRKDPDFDEFGITSLNVYIKDYRLRQEEMRVQDLSDIGVNPESAVRNDTEVLDYIIQTGFTNMMAAEGAAIHVADVFRAMDRKSKILGAAYKGQTLWALLDNQQAMIRVFELLREIVPRQYVDKLIERMVEEGLATPSDSYDYGLNVDLEDLDTELERELRVD